MLVLHPIFLDSSSCAKQADNQPRTNAHSTTQSCFAFGVRRAKRLASLLCCGVKIKINQSRNLVVESRRGTRIVGPIFSFILRSRPIVGSWVCSTQQQQQQQQLGVGNTAAPQDPYDLKDWTTRAPAPTSQDVVAVPHSSTLGRPRSHQMW